MSETTPLKWWQSLLSGALPNIYVGVAIGALLLLAGYVASVIVERQTADPTFSFIGIVIIFMTALTVAATIFVGLKLANPQEAFGLPSGSMRALLAIGVMILFVVFGLPMVSPQGAVPIASKVSSVPATELQAAIQLHREQGLRVRVLDYGSAAIPAAGGNPPRDARPASFETYGRVDVRSPEEVDFGKQILTAIITLLTSVISFYFGSRSAADALGQPAGGTAPAAPTEVTALRKQLQASLAALNGALLAAGGKIHTLKADPATAGNAARLAALAEAEPLRQTAEAVAGTIAGHLAAADAALAAAATATREDERQRHEAVARDRLQQGTNLAAEAAKAQQAYSAKVESIG